MESLGNRLRTVREARGLSHGEISGETNISSRYLEALEKEDFSCFPGEPYVLGFLKNYGDYLDIDQEELLSLYRSFKLQEQPVPVEQLLRDPSPLPKIMAIAAIFLALAGIVLGVIYFVIPRLPQRVEAASQTARMPQEYNLAIGFLERRLYPGDSVLISGQANAYRLVFSGLGEAVTITTPRGPVMLDLGQEVAIDLDNDGFTELRIIAADFVRNDSVSGALLRFEHESPPPLFAETSPEILEALGPGPEAPVLIYSAQNPQPFTLQAVFQAYCLFRYEVLFEQNRPGRTENYYQRFDELNITAQNGIRLGISNAQAVRLQVMIGGRAFSFETGGPGEVVAADLRWIRDEENRFRLMLIRLD